MLHPFAGVPFRLLGFLCKQVVLLLQFLLVLGQLYLLHLPLLVEVVELDHLRLEVGNPLAFLLHRHLQLLQVLRCVAQLLLRHLQLLAQLLQLFLQHCLVVLSLLELPLHCFLLQLQLLLHLGN